MSQLNLKILEARVKNQRDDGDYMSAAKTALILADAYEEIGHETYPPYWRGSAYGLLMKAKSEDQSLTGDKAFTSVLEVCQAYTMIYERDQ